MTKRPTRNTTKSSTMPSHFLWKNSDFQKRTPDDTDQNYISSGHTSNLKQITFTVSWHYSLCKYNNLHCKFETNHIYRLDAFQFVQIQQPLIVESRNRIVERNGGTWGGWRPLTLHLDQSSADYTASFNDISVIKFAEPKQQVV